MNFTFIICINDAFKCVAALKLSIPLENKSKKSIKFKFLYWLLETVKTTSFKYQVFCSIPDFVVNVLMVLPLHF